MNIDLLFSIKMFVILFYWVLQVICEERLFLFQRHKNIIEY